MGLFEPKIGKLEKKRDIKELINALKYKKSFVIRENAAEALGRIGNAEAVDPLIDALRDEWSYVRGEAAKALGKIGNKQAVEPLLSIMKDKDSIVRAMAVEALEKLGWKPRDETERFYYLFGKKEWNEIVNFGELAIEPLIDALEDYQEEVRIGATKIFGTIKNPKAIEPLMKSLMDFGVHFSVKSKMEAVEALGKIGEPAIKPLLKILMDRTGIPQSILELAAIALGRIGEPAVPTLIELFKNENPMVRFFGALAMRNIIDPIAIFPLKKALEENEDAYIKEQVAKVVERLKKFWEDSMVKENQLSGNIAAEKLQKLKEFLGIGPNDVIGHFKLGVAFACTGRAKEAIECLQEFVRLAGPEETSRVKQVEEMIRQIRAEM